MRALILVLFLLCSTAPYVWPVEPTPPEDGPPIDAGAEVDETAIAEEGEESLEDGGQAVVGQIVVDGNVRVSDNAFFKNLRIESGDPYDEERIRDEFRHLWELNLFDDISVESRRRSTGVYDLIFHVRDRPLIGSVKYEGMKAITETNILERLSQAETEVRRGQPVDFSVLRRAEATIEHLLGEKGHLQARVRARLTQVHRGQQEVTFHIREGAKTKIKKIDFVGNTIFTDRELRKMLKFTKQAFWLTSWASSKPLYHPMKLEQDSENIRDAYKSRGYLDVVIEPEVVELESEVKRRERLEKDGEGSGEPAPRSLSFDPFEDDEEWEDIEEPPPPPPSETEKERKKRLKAEKRAAKEREKLPKKWVFLTIPVVEGVQYRVGRIEVEGNSVFSDREVMARLPLRSGMVYNDSRVKFGTRRLEEDYGERGYFYVSLDPRVEKEGNIAHLTLDVTEDKRYFVDRIEFTGNTTTRDKVLRREMRLSEEDLFNVRLLRLGLRKIAQLGYWQVGGEPVVNPVANTNRVNIEVQGVESSRNEIQVGGGVSGIDGGFFQGSYATRNFLGRGEILSAFLQTGSRGSRYSLNFTEPFFLGKPWTLGFSLFNQVIKYSGFERQGTGGRLVVGRLLGNFSRYDVVYGFEEIDYRPTEAGLGSASVTRTSSVTNIYSFDTRNNFFRPTRGVRLVTSLEYAGGSLGGDNYFVKFRQDGTLYLPGLARGHYVGLKGSYGRVTGFDGREVPWFERFYLGGERSLRAFRTREVSPMRQDIDLNGNGYIDYPEDLNGNGILDPSEDLNGNYVLDTEDLNGNGVLDPGEDANGNGVLDTEDRDGDGLLQLGEDLPDGAFTPFCPADDLNMNGLRDSNEGDFGNCRLDAGEDTNGDGVYGTVFPGGDQYLLFNVEYAIPLTDTVEFAAFYDAGNAFDDNQSIRLDEFRVDYGLEMRFYLPVFQAPLRLIYAVIQDPREGEDPSNFIFSIGTTF